MLYAHTNKAVTRVLEILYSGEYYIRTVKVFHRITYRSYAYDIHKQPRRHDVGVRDRPDGRGGKEWADSCWGHFA